MGILAIFISISLFFSILALVGRFGWIRYFMENPPRRERVSVMQIGLRRHYLRVVGIVPVAFQWWFSGSSLPFIGKLRGRIRHEGPLLPKRTY